MKITNKSITQQGSQEWLDFRLGKVGGSDAAVVLEKSPYKSAFRLWKEKKGLAEPDPMNDAMRLGHELEPIARDLFQYQSGIQMYPAVYVHDNHPQIMASLDGINYEGNRILEIKCGKKAFQMACVGDIDETYRIQCQHNMAVTGALICDFFAYSVDPHYNRGIHFVIERDEKFISEMIEKELEFIDSLSKDAPPGYKLLDTDEDLKFLVQRRNHYKKYIDTYQNILDKLDSQLIDLAKDDNLIIDNLKVYKVNRQGSISYKKAVEELLPDADLEKFRSESSSYYRIGNV